MGIVLLGNKEGLDDWFLRYDWCRGAVSASAGRADSGLAPPPCGIGDMTISLQQRGQRALCPTISNAEPSDEMPRRHFGHG
jgi:hypothetical protein